MNSDQNPLDPSNFRQMIIESPGQFAKGFALAKDIQLDGNFKQVVISGMGGSALHGDILKVILADLFEKSGQKPLPITLNRFYTLPSESFDNALNILCSYSGNTEETIASFNEVIDKKLPCIGLSSGGKIEEMCQEHEFPFVKLPMPFPNFQPRIGTGYFIGAIYQILINLGLAPNKTDDIISLSEKLTGDLVKLESTGKELAQKLIGKTPIIFAADKYRAIAMVWKIKMNENAKTPAFYNVFPELNHNEMVGYTNPQGKFFSVMLRDPSDKEQNVKRYTATKDLIAEKGIESEIIALPEGEVFYKVFWSIILADFTSYYLALAYKQDPTPVDMVEALKKILAK